MIDRRFFLGDDDLSREDKKAALAAQRRRVMAQNRQIKRERLDTLKLRISSAKRRKSA